MATGKDGWESVGCVCDCELSSDSGAPLAASVKSQSMKPLSARKVSKEYNSSELDNVPTTDPMT